MDETAHVRTYSTDRPTGEVKSEDGVMVLYVGRKLKSEDAAILMGLPLTEQPEQIKTGKDTQA